MVEHERTGWIDAFTWRFSRLAMVIPAVIVAIMAYEVVMRYIFESATLWVNELSLWLAGMCYLFAGLYAMQQRSHIRIFILYDVCPRWLRRSFDVISVLCLLAFVIATFWGGFGEAYAKLMRWERFGTAWDPPIPATMKPLILLSLIILAIQAISNLVNDWDKDPEVYDAEVDPEIEEIKAAQGIKES
ncbi:MAG: TRAP transporter small permease [Stappiaceae bacterium]